MLKKYITDSDVRFEQNGKTILLMESRLGEGCAEIRFTGELRGELAHELTDELTAYALLGWQVTLEMSKVTYLASSVLSALFDVNKRFAAGNRGSLLLKAPSEEVTQLLGRTGMDSLFHIL